MQYVQADVTRRLAKAAQQQTKYYNKRRRHITYKRGDKVYVDARYLPSTVQKGVWSFRHKFANKREGPFVVTRRLNAAAYKVRVPKGRAHYMEDVTFSVDKLTPYRVDERWTRDSGAVRPDFLRVRQILRTRKFTGRTREYFVRYEDAHPGLDEWIIAPMIKPKTILQQFRQRHGFA
jgi:hypothetical protein